MSDSRLADVAQQIHDVAVAALDGGLLPAYTVVQTGPAHAADPCERLAIHATGVAVVQSAGQAGALTDQMPAVGCQMVPVGLITVTLAYCIPKSGDAGQPIPTASDITAASLRLYTGAMTLLAGLADACAAGDLGDCDSVTIGPVEFPGPAGGQASARIPLRVALTGVTTAS